MSMLNAECRMQKMSNGECRKCRMRNTENADYPLTIRDSSFGIPHSPFSIRHSSALSI